MRAWPTPFAIVAIPVAAGPSFARSSAFDAEVSLTRAWTDNALYLGAAEEASGGASDRITTVAVSGSVSAEWYAKDFLGLVTGVQYVNQSGGQSGHSTGRSSPSGPA